MLLLLELKGKKYKITYDPDLDKHKSKGKQPIYQFNGKGSRLPATDPRKLCRDYPKNNDRSQKRKYLPSTLTVCRYVFDQHSVEPKPPSQILVSNISKLITDNAVAVNFKRFGEFEEFCIQRDPTTNASLGLCLIRFKNTSAKDLASGHHAAKKALKEAANGKMKIGIDSVVVEFDEEGTKCRDLVDKLCAENAAGRKAAAAAAAENAAKLAPPPAKTPPPLVSKESEDSVIDDILDKIGPDPYIFISDKYVPVSRVYNSDIKDYLRDYDWIKVYSEERIGFWVVFDSQSEARACFRQMDGRLIFNYRLNMDLHLHRERSGRRRRDDDDRRTPHAEKRSSLAAKSAAKPSHVPIVQPKKSTDPVKDASALVLKELTEMFRKDVKERITIPKIYDVLAANATQKSVAGGAVDGLADKTAHPVKVEPAAVPEKKIEDALDVMNFSGKLPSLPRFKKRNQTPMSRKTLTRKRPLNHQLNSEDSRDDIMDDIDRSGTATPDGVRTGSARRSLLQSELESDMLDSLGGSDEDAENDDLETGGLRKGLKRKSEEDGKAERKRKMVHVDFTTSEEEDDDDDDEDDDDNDDERVDGDSVMTGMDEMPGEAMADLSYWMPSEKLRAETDDADRLMDLDGVQSSLMDEEDYQLLAIALEDQPQAEIINADFWCWQHKQAKANRLGGVVGPTKRLRPSDEYNKQHSTGSARTEGYYKIPETDKTDYLEHRKRLRKKRADNAAAAAAGVPPPAAPKNEGESMSSRMNRINNRKLAADITLQKQMLSTENDVLRFNQLKKRKRAVRFARSAIHNWGLYAMENIGANEMIIEYVGEVVRQQVADMRERRYIKNGIGSSYLFRIDESTVVDATKRGGIARFINHCCTPSCTAKIIKVDGQKRIVIYALRDITANEELTYDYKFEREVNSEERIPCLCGSAGCKGFLN
ncbi:histone-lysine N-methyltransferase-like protein, H3 lysine-4 specific [Dipodascopsis tothii]|uniref:histone-lysine N-methyltransferase-like protein, H3 lysine-4 specific n=1 Tax=Dipodascopsis tothii TaxID=44089 RepID=UPI0034CE80DC